MIHRIFASMIVSLMCLKTTCLRTGLTRQLSNKACFGAGCYWGTEKYFRKEFAVKKSLGSIDVASCEVGFMAPTRTKENPTYEEVCTGTTSYVEVCQFEFDGSNNTFKELVRHFFKFHDPTTSNRQGLDVGTQYASTIYYFDEMQREIATQVKNELQKVLDERITRTIDYEGKVISTAILPATQFFPAHADHQNFLSKNPYGYCNHRYRFYDWPNK